MFFNFIFFHFVYDSPRLNWLSRNFEKHKFIFTIPQNNSASWLLSIAGCMETQSQSDIDLRGFKAANHGYLDSLMVCVNFNPSSFCSGQENLYSAAFF